MHIFMCIKRAERTLKARSKPCFASALLCGVESSNPEIPDLDAVLDLADFSDRQSDFTAGDEPGREVCRKMCKSIAVSRVNTA